MIGLPSNYGQVSAILFEKRFLPVCYLYMLYVALIVTFYSDYLAYNVSLSASLLRYLSLHFFILSQNALQPVYLSHSLLFQFSLSFSAFALIASFLYGIVYFFPSAHWCNLSLEGE